jgi:hypothetical protein
MTTASGIRPGDLLFTRPGGISAWVIRHGSGANWAHCGTFTGLIEVDGAEEVWETVEALADGVKFRERRVPIHPEPGTERDLLVLRPWRDDHERLAIVATACEWGAAGLRYGWEQIARIVLHGLGIDVTLPDRPGTAICSHQAWAAVLAARPELAARTRYRPCDVWPGHLADILLSAPGVTVVPRVASDPLEGTFLGARPLET